MVACGKTRLKHLAIEKSGNVAQRRFCFRHKAMGNLVHMRHIGPNLQFGIDISFFGIFTRRVLSSNNTSSEPTCTNIGGNPAKSAKTGDISGFSYLDWGNTNQSLAACARHQSSDARHALYVNDRKCQIGPRREKRDRFRLCLAVFAQFLHQSKAKTAARTVTGKQHFLRYYAFSIK